jgi:hypothetical protein
LEADGGSKFQADLQATDFKIIRSANNSLRKEAILFPFRIPTGQSAYYGFRCYTY